MGIAAQRSGADGQRSLYARRSVAASRDPDAALVPDAASALLDQLAVPNEARRFADLAEALPVGRALPAPQGIFPRYVEAEAASA